VTAVRGRRWAACGPPVGRLWAAGGPPVGRPWAACGPMDPEPQSLYRGRAQMPGANGPTGGGARAVASSRTQNRDKPNPFWARADLWLGENI